MKKFKKCSIVLSICLICCIGIFVKTKASPNNYNVESTHLLNYLFDTNVFFVEDDILPSTLEITNFNNYGILLVDDAGGVICGGWFSDMLIIETQIYLSGMTLDSNDGGYIDFLIFYDGTNNVTYITITKSGNTIVTVDDGYYLNFISSVHSYNCEECEACPEVDVGSFSEFLVDGVGGFLNFEVIPGWSLVSILSIFLAIALVVIILRYFAGG